MTQSEASKMHALCTKILSSPSAHYSGDAFCLFDETSHGTFQINSYLDCMHIERQRVLLTEEWRRMMVRSGKSIFTLQYEGGEPRWCTILSPNSLAPRHELLNGLPDDELKAAHLMIQGGPARRVIHRFSELPWLQEVVAVLEQHAETLG